MYLIFLNDYKRLLQKQKAIDSDSADLHQPTVYVS